MIQIFRALVALNLVLFLIFSTLPFFDAQWYDVEVQNLRDWANFNAILSHPLFYYVYVVAGVLIPIGLFFFIQGARQAFAAYWLVSTFFGLLYGISILTPLEATLGAIVGALDGAIITMSFFTSVSKQWQTDVA